MDLEVARGDLERVRVREVPAPGLQDGDARLRVEGFALSANNISYAVFGDMLRYWDFFPGGPADAGDDTVWGRIPVWGFGEVVETRSPDVAVGERLYGYFPMSSELVISPGRADERGVFDTAAHRAAMASAYNRYVRCATDPAYRVDREDHQMLLFPLFFTSFLIDDFLVDRSDFGAEQIVVSSASSKTAIGVAFLAHQRGRRVVGLTSAGNVEFVESLGVVDEVVSYDDVATVSAVPSVYVDIAGNGDVRHAVHARLGGLLGYSMTVGGTHWDHRADTPPDGLPGPTPEFFFAPDQISKRSQEWGRDMLDARIGEAWDRYATWVDGWIDLRHARGSEAVTAVYTELLAGRVDPRVGHICTLVEEVTR
jgi:NADPH:quinone reductase-like Zn-dependent oxidoreductase